MNTIVAKLTGGRRANFDVPFTCPCGASRRVFARGLDPHLPISEAPRDLGECGACGRGGTWRITNRSADYLVEVTPDA